MKWAFSTAGLVVMGLVGIIIIILFQSITVNNEHDYYLLKETAEAAMFDAIDIPYYRDKGEVKIVQEKFVENFMRRLAEAANKINIADYSVEFYDIMEKPPKVSILIKTGLGQYKVYGDVNDYDISNQLDAILEADDTKLNNDYYYNCKTIVDRNYYLSRNQTNRLTVNIPKYNNNQVDLSLYKIVDVKYIRQILTFTDSNAAGVDIRNVSEFSDSVNVRNFGNVSNYRYGQRNIDVSYRCGDCRVGSCYCGFVYDVVWKHKSCEKKGGN